MNREQLAHILRAAATIDSALIDPTILSARIDLLPASLDPRVKTRLHSGVRRPRQPVVSEETRARRWTP